MDWGQWGRSEKHGVSIDYKKNENSRLRGTGGGRGAVMGRESQGNKSSMARVERSQSQTLHLISPRLLGATFPGCIELLGKITALQTAIYLERIRFL